VRAATDDRKLREEWMNRICERLQAHAVQRIGKVLVIYRENPEKEPDKPGLDSRSMPRARVAGKDELKRTGRPRSRTPSPRPESGPRRRRPRTSR
jgi:hypothetical protein